MHIAACVMWAGCVSPHVALKRGFDFSRIRRVAVLPLSGPGGDAAADIFAQELLVAGADIIERQRLAEVLKELRLSVSGVVNPSGAKRLGEILDVDAIFTGTIISYTQPQSYLIVGADAGGRGQAAAAIGRGAVSLQGPALGVAGSEIITSAATVGLAIRMVHVETGALLWAASQSYEAYDITTALQLLARSFVKSLEPIWPVPGR